MLRAVLFDIDDTLFDQRRTFRAALASLQTHYREFFGALSLEDAENVHLQILNEVHKDVLSGAIAMEEARKRRFSKLLSHFNINVSEKTQAEMQDYLRASYRAARRATDGAIPFLHELRARDITIGVVSNNILEEQVEKLRICGLTELIDSITVSEEARVAKPDLEIFRIALERLGRTPEETVMIGDSWENDIYPARSLGMKTIWFNNYGTKSQDHSVATITSFGNIPEVLRLMSA